MRRPSFIARQASRPSGILGRLLLGVMARETSRFNRVVLDAVAPGRGEHILEVGYGHGSTLAAAAARAPGSRLSGIDVSPDAARTAAGRCAALGPDRVDLRVGDSGALPWADATFDKAYSVHTIYFWSDPARDLGELHRVLRPGGQLVLGFRERSDDAIARFPAPVYQFRTADEVGALLVTAGFTVAALERSDAGPGLWVVAAVAA